MPNKLTPTRWGSRRTSTTGQTSRRSFLATELALKAQKQAQRISLRKQVTSE